MDSFESDNAKAEKASAVRRYSRHLELCLSLVFLSWISTRLPLALEISGDYFRQHPFLIASPLFVFLLCNAIIATLILSSGRLSGDNAESELYGELMRNSGDRAKSLYENHTEDVVFEDKEIIFERSTTIAAWESEVEIEVRHSLSPETEDVAYEDKEIVSEETREIPASESEVDSDQKVYRRTVSEMVKEERSERVCPKLRRSETQKCGKMVSTGENPAENLYPEDKLSNEEFQRTIEEFIAKQLKFRREESFAVVLHNWS